VRINIFISLLFVLFSFFNLNAQTYNYSYTDPCTGNVKNIIVPINGSVTVGYYGFVENFTQQQFTDGTFETWANQVFSQYDGSPCSEIVGLGGQINMAQDVALNTIGIINSLSSLMDLSNGATDFLSGSLTAASNSSNTKGNKGNKKNGNSSQNGSGNNNNGTTTNTNNSTTNNNQNQNNGTSNTTEGSQTTSGTNETSSNNGGNGTTNQNGGTQNPTSAGGTTTESGSNENGNSQASQPINNQNTNTNENNSNTPVGSNTGESSGNGTSGNGEGNNQTNQEVTNNGSTTNSSGNGSNNGGNSGVGNNSGNSPNGEETTTQPEEQGGGQTNITQGATKTINQNREGGKPTVIASGDFVGFNFQNSEVRTGLKLTGGYHNMRWDGETARGGLVDYVSAQQGPNITGYHAWINKKSVGLLSGTLSVGFEGRGSVYGTLAGGQMFMFPKIPSLKAVYMGTVSYGQVYKTSFLGTALIGGGMYDLKFGKRIDVKLMGLFVYSPYVSYYNDLVLKSPYVILPSLGTNIAITKRFKFNINAGGAWAIKVNTLNYTITCGTRLLVGQ
jgi:hypothetical protein